MNDIYYINADFACVISTRGIDIVKDSSYFHLSVRDLAPKWEQTNDGRDSLSNVLERTTDEQDLLVYSPDEIRRMCLIINGMPKITFSDQNAKMKLAHECVFIIPRINASRLNVWLLRQQMEIGRLTERMSCVINKINLLEEKLNICNTPCGSMHISGDPVNRNKISQVIESRPIVDYLVSYPLTISCEWS